MTEEQVNQVSEILRVVSANWLVSLVEHEIISHGEARQLLGLNEPDQKEKSDYGDKSGD